MEALFRATIRGNQRTKADAWLFAFAVGRVTREHATQGAVNAPPNVNEHREPPCLRGGLRGWRREFAARVPFWRQVIFYERVAFKRIEPYSIKLNSSPPAHGERLNGESEHPCARSLMTCKSTQPGT